MIVGENRTFDHVFGALMPRQGQTVSNLLSKGIITEDGKPGRTSRSRASTKAKRAVFSHDQQSHA